MHCKFLAWSGRNVAKMFTSKHNSYCKRLLVFTLMKKIERKSVKLSSKTCAMQTCPLKYISFTIFGVKFFTHSHFFSKDLKVRQSRNDFFKPTILPKYERTYYDTSGRLVFVRFWKKLKTPRRHFEINWPLLLRPTFLLIWIKFKYTY